MFVLKTFEYVRLKDVLKTPSEDEDERSLQDVFIKTYVCGVELFNPNLGEVLGLF